MVGGMNRHGWWERKTNRFKESSADFWRESSFRGEEETAAEGKRAREYVGTALWVRRKKKEHFVLEGEVIECGGLVRQGRNEERRAGDGHTHCR